MTPIYYMHIEKTGGTSLSAAIARKYPADRIFTDDGAISVPFLNSIEDRLQSDAFIAGHPHPGVVEHLWNRARIITVVRDPAHQAASYYLHAQRDPAHIHHTCATTLSLHDYLRKHPGYLVFQTSSIAAASASGITNVVDFSVKHTGDVIALMRRFDIVGVTERLNELGPIVSKLMFGGSGVRVPRLNSAISLGSEHAVLDKLVLDYRELEEDYTLAPYIEAERQVYDAAGAMMEAMLSRSDWPTDEALRRSSERLPASLLHCVGGRLSGGAYEIPLGRVSGPIIYGPYESLEPGSYEVEFHISMVGVAALSRGLLLVEVVAHPDRRLAKRVIRGDVGRRRVALSFANADRRDVLEYRIFCQGHTRGALRFDGVTIHRRPSPPSGSSTVGVAAPRARLPTNLSGHRR